MNSTAIIAIVAAVVVVAAGAGTAIYVMNKDDKGDEKNPDQLPVDKLMDGAALKVLGNVNKDGAIDQKDIDAFQALLDDKKSYEDCPIADANNDQKLDEADKAVIESIVNKQSTTIYHVNYYDSDKDGIMEMHLVDTKYPITSCIISGSANTGLTLMMLGIINQVRGAAYSGTSLDKTLFTSTFLNTTFVEKIGTSASKISFESGLVNGSSKIIKEKNVTALITDWNRSYIENWEDFENAKVDVVRGAAASTDPVVAENTYRTYGLLFMVDQERVDNLVTVYTGALNDIAQKAATITAKKKAVACSSDGSISAGNSDYTALITLVGDEFGLAGYDAAGSASVKVSEKPEVFGYDFDYVLHIRTSLGYAAGTDPATAMTSAMTSPFATWDANEGKVQYLITGVAPVPIRAAYVGHVLNPDVYSLEWANGLHAQFAAFYTGVTVDLTDHAFFYTAEA